MKAKGILTIAYGKQKYVLQAISLARSIRLRDPDLLLAVATDFPETIFGGHFNEVIPWDFTEWPDLVSKLEIFNISPFETTLFLDADCLAIQSLELVFAYFEGQHFAVFGQNTLKIDGWITSLNRIQKAIPSKSYPLFNGGLYYFTHSPLANEVFFRARLLRKSYDELELKRTWRGTENEEPLISLAMAQLGLFATSNIMYPVHRTGNVYN